MTAMVEQLLAGEFAKRAGVTVRTLHHYDRVGLLKPGARSPAGYRLYGADDLARLQHIAALKFLGVPLRRIKALLERSPHDLRETLRLQRRLLGEQRSRLDAALVAIERADRAASENADGPDWPSLRAILEVLTMHKNSEWVKKYYSDEQLADLAARDGADVRTRGERDWAQLIADVEASLGDDPAGERGQALAERWTALIGAFTGGDPGIRENLQKLYADRANWPATVEMPYSSAVGEFIAKAVAARDRDAG
jgi:DNA-binding transcriptional MerR regulator